VLAFPVLFAQPPVDVLTDRYDIGRSRANLRETYTPRNRLRGAIRQALRARCGRRHVCPALIKTGAIP